MSKKILKQGLKTLRSDLSALSRYNSPNRSTGELLKNIGSAKIGKTVENGKIVDRILRPTDIKNETLLNRLRQDVSKGGKPNVEKILTEAYDTDKGYNIIAEAKKAEAARQAEIANKIKARREASPIKVSRDTPGNVSSVDASGSTVRKLAQDGEAIKYRHSVPKGNRDYINKKSDSIGTRVSQYMRKKWANEVGDLQNAFDSGMTITDDIVDKFSSRLRMSDARAEKFKKAIASGDKNTAMSFVNNNTAREQFVNSAGTMDKMFAHKVPQMAAGGVGTAWLVSGMSATKGQQTNSQLYGQSQPYR